MWTKKKFVSFVFPFIIKDTEAHVSIKLIYRGSEDGFRAEDFHRKCDGVSNTLTFIK